MTEKKITIEKLAVIINKGFQGQMDYMEKKFETINKNFTQVASKKELGEVKKDVKYIKENVEDARKLGQRVDRIENMLDMPALKK